MSLKNPTDPPTDMQSSALTSWDIRPVPFSHPDAVLLNDLVQREYDEQYGDGGDITPLDATMFAPPHGLYLVAYDHEGAPVASGGWRAMDATGRPHTTDPATAGVRYAGYQDGDAELKRMYVVPRARRRGLSRVLLTALEEDARAAGRVRMVLETAVRQSAAVALYTSSGYAPCPGFGVYRHHPLSLFYAKPLTPH